MRVLVSGATGVLGRALLPQLMQAGQEVFGLARTPEKLLLLDKLGAKPLRGDLLDAEAVRKAVQDSRPDVLINIATAVPRKLKLDPKDWDLNNRVRLEGSAHLQQAAQETGVRHFIQESVGYVLESQGDGWLDESAPLADLPFILPTIQMEENARRSSVPTTILRFAALMSADAWHTQQTVAALRRGLLPVIGEGESFLSQIHSEDAARAILCALNHPDKAAGQTFHVGDDEPVRLRELLPYAAQVLGADAPHHVPPMLAKMIIGAFTLERLTTSYRMSNAKIKRELDFTPRYPTYRETWTQIAQETSGKEFTPSGDLS